MNRSVVHLRAAGQYGWAPSPLLFASVILVAFHMYTVVPVIQLMKVVSESIMELSRQSGCVWPISNSELVQQVITIWYEAQNKVFWVES